MNTLPPHPYATPQRIGSVDIWHTDDGWWMRRANEEGPWRPAPSTLVKLAKQYTVVTKELDKGRKRWQNIK